MPEDISYAPVALKGEDLLIRPVWSILTKGLTGSGKSLFALGKEFRPIYVFDFEGRIDSALHYYKKMDGNVDGIETNHYPFTDTSSFFKMDKKMDEIVAQGGRYKTVLCSTLTSYIRLVMAHLKNASVEKNTGADGRVKGVRKKGGIQVNILEDFNFEDAAVIDQLVGFFQLCRAQGMNTILECHITPIDIRSINEETGEKEAITRDEILTKGKKAPAEVPSWFNEVWLFEKMVVGGWDSQSTKYRVNTAGNATTPCKTSFGIPSFEWTGIDGSVKLMELLSGDIKDNPRVDPRAPKITGGW